MSDLLQRDYYKIFTGTNQSGGYDKIHLGYNAETTEIDFPKDTTTYFHMPFFASIQSVHDSTLIADGAIPGPIPALADRVYKKLGNYGNSTSWGTPTERSDGTWLCTWLYAVSSEPPVWKDRYFNPGRLSYKEALEGTANFTDYINNDPLYYDIDSQLTFEPGVLYQYFHQGENSALDYVKSFAGNDKTRLKLNIEDWSCMCSNDPRPVDSSIYNNDVIIENFTLDWVKNIYEPGYRDRNALSFDNTNFINARVTYNDSYNSQNEFTASFWVKSDNWSKASSTQLVGNLNLGGVGIFYNNLNTNPYFVVPENTYGHLFYFNQEGFPYLDKNIQIVLGQPSKPTFTFLNSNSEVICIDTSTQVLRIGKYNHVGDRLTLNKYTNGGLFQLHEAPVGAILGLNDLLTVTTTLSTYIFDKDLLLLQNLPVQRESPTSLIAPVSTIFASNSALSGLQLSEIPLSAIPLSAIPPQPQDDFIYVYDIEGTLHKQYASLDAKFDSLNNKWHINNNGNLFCNNVPINIPSNNLDGEGTNTNIAIDPENNIWVLAGSNIIYKLNYTSRQIIDTYDVGVLSNEADFKNIGFIKTYNRKTNSHTWYAIIYHSFEKTLYQVTLDGKIYKVTYLPPLLNPLDPAVELQNKELLTYLGRGDFTGYEHRRIFNKIQFNNNPQIELKVSVKPTNALLPNSIYKISVPVQYLTDRDWHLVTVTLKNRLFSLYIDNALRDTLEIPGNVDLTYQYKNDLYIGTPCGKTGNYNTEILSQGMIWNGYIDSIKIYDYAINPKFIQFFIREKTYASDIEWNIPTASLPYVEVIDRFFKHRLPGSKSTFFNIRLSGTTMKDPTLRKRVENDIKIAIEQIKPAYTELLKVEWID